MDCIGFTSTGSIKSILRTAYGLEVTKISRMDSFSNVNYLVSCLLENSEATEMTVVVKIYQQKAASFFDNSELQHLFMLHLCKNGFRCSEPLRTKDGETYVISTSDEADFLLQVLTFLPGISINSSKLDNDGVLRICYLAGQNLGKLHLIGQNLDFKFESRNPQFRLLPQNALELKKYLSSISDANIVEEIQKWMKLYEDNFLPELTNLRKGYIHGDFSDCNIIVTKNGEEWQFGGIIDFEHCHYGYLVGDLGICIAYFLMKAVSVGCDVLLAAATLIRGYQSNNLLTKVEKFVLPDAIMSRVCVSYILGCHQAALHPENSTFIFLQSKHVPKLLDQLGKIKRSQILESLY